MTNVNAIGHRVGLARGNWKKISAAAFAEISALRARCAASELALEFEMETLAQVRALANDWSRDLGYRPMSPEEVCGHKLLDVLNRERIPLVGAPGETSHG